MSTYPSTFVLAKYIFPVYGNIIQEFAALFFVLASYIPAHIPEFGTLAFPELEGSFLSLGAIGKCFSTENRENYGNTFHHLGKSTFGATSTSEKMS